MEPLEQNHLQLVIDALPYVDTLIDDNEEERESAMRLVEDEMEIFPPDKDYLEYLPINFKSRPFNTPLIEREYQSIETNEIRPPSSNLSEMKSDTPPTSSPLTSTDDLESWIRCLNQLKVNIEYRQKQLTNLELLKLYGKIAWEQYMDFLESIKSDLSSEICNIEKKTHEINWDRKSSHEKVAKAIQIFQNDWSSLSDRNRAISREIRRLQKDFTNNPET